MPERRQVRSPKAPSHKLKNFVGSLTFYCISKSDGKIAQNDSLVQTNLSCTHTKFTRKKNQFRGCQQNHLTFVIGSSWIFLHNESGFISDFCFRYLQFIHFFLLHYITKFKIPKFKTRKLMIPSNITWNMIPIYLPKLICEAAENLFVHPLPLREILAYYWDFPALHRIDWD